MTGWIKIEEWDKTEGSLSVGDEVTANGELSRQSIAADSFWVTVMAVGSEDNTYTVRDSDGKETTQSRRDLRRRVFHRECFMGCTGDRKHDTFSMRHFSVMEFEALAKRGVFRRQKINRICTHSGCFV